MAVGQFPEPILHPVAGVSLATICAGIKQNERDDVLVICCDKNSSISAVFTQNRFCAAPVVLAKKHLNRDRQTNQNGYLLVNSGNANACTGEQGMEAAAKTCHELASLAGVTVEQVLPFSTGVIGELLPAEKIISVLPDAVTKLRPDAWRDAARAIMTTDTRPKGASEQFVFDGKTVTVTGIAKGSGMIKPNMATMLSYIATDIDVEQELLDKILRECVKESFNQIVVDGDTSTNDACVLMATGQSGVHCDKAEGELFQALLSTVKSVHVQLAKAIVMDGEGATKFVTLQVNGGASTEECQKVAYAVAQSPLVKTALFASDPNWGRIVAAIGYAGIEDLDSRKVNVKLDDVSIVTNGERCPTYKEELGQTVMSRDEITIQIELARGQSKATVWTCDLSHDYVRINAEYRS